MDQRKHGPLLSRAGALVPFETHWMKIPGCCFPSVLSSNTSQTSFLIEKKLPTVDVDQMSSGIAWDQFIQTQGTWQTASKSAERTGWCMSQWGCSLTSDVLSRVGKIPSGWRRANIHQLHFKLEGQLEKWQIDQPLFVLYKNHGASLLGMCLRAEDWESQHGFNKGIACEFLLE